MDASTLDQPACVIITGMPAAGKSTLTRMVSSRLDRAARVDDDELSAMIISGGVWALGDPAAEAVRQVDLCHRNDQLSDAGPLDDSRAAGSHRTAQVRSHWSRSAFSAD